jgi:cob(I)alamin adenosyltransferase
MDSVKIYTKRGDQGDTDLFGGVRVSKDDARVEAYGAVDELNACLGQCVTASAHKELRAITQSIQSMLFDLGGYLAAPDDTRREQGSVAGPEDSDIEVLEAHIDALEEELEPLKRFILPGGTTAAAAYHLARTVCRRAERRVVALHREQPLNAQSLRYLNRLSDLLFVLARVENHRAGIADVEWVGRNR